MQRLVQRSFYTLAISKFKQGIQDNVLSNTAPNINPPQVVSTADR